MAITWPMGLPFRLGRRRAGVRPPRRVVEREEIRTFGELDRDRVVRAIHAVILGKLSPQPSGLNANHGIKLGVKISGATENFRRNLVFLDGSSGMVQRVFRQVAQKFAQGFGAVQDLAADQFLDLREILFPFGQR
jgi:hypothetical protein